MTNSTKTKTETIKEHSEFQGQNLEKQDDSIMFIDGELVEELITPDPSNRVDKDNHAHINRLKKSMLDKGFSKHAPIIVGNDGMIKAGHHRYYAATELGIGVWIKVDNEYDLKTLSQIEGVAKKWTSMDWILKYANEGVGDYPNILNFCEQYGFGVKVNLMILTNKANESSQEVFDRIVAGEFEVDDWEKAHWKARCIKAFAPYLEQEKECHNTYFAAAVLHCLGVKGYSHDEMLRKVKVQSRMLRLQRNRRDNLEMLQTIYNYKRQQANKLVFVSVK